MSGKRMRRPSEGQRLQAQNCMREAEEYQAAIRKVAAAGIQKELRVFGRNVSLGHRNRRSCEADHREAWCAAAAEASCSAD